MSGQSRPKGFCRKRTKAEPEALDCSRVQRARRLKTGQVKLDGPGHASNRRVRISRKKGGEENALMLEKVALIGGQPEPELP